jgi:hypothetical protein
MTLGRGLPGALPSCLFSSLVEIDTAPVPRAFSLKSADEDMRRSDGLETA